MKWVKRGVKVPKMQKLNVLSDFECFPRFWDAVKPMEEYIRVL